MVESTGAPAFTRIITRLRSRAPPACKWPCGLAGSLHTLQLHFILKMGDPCTAHLGFSSDVTKSFKSLYPVNFLSRPANTALFSTE